MEKKRTQKERTNYVNNQGAGGAVFYKDGKVVLDTRKKKAGNGKKK